MNLFRFIFCLAIAGSLLCIGACGGPAPTDNDGSDGKGLNPGEALPEIIATEIVDPGGSHQLKVVGIQSDGSGRRPLASGWLYAPPRAGWIAYVSGSDPTLYTMKIVGGIPIRVASRMSEFIHQQGAISPDGSRIAYLVPNLETGYPNDAFLYVAGIDGSNPFLLASNAHVEGTLDYSVTNKIAFVTVENEVRIVNVNGSGARGICRLGNAGFVVGPYDEFSLQWSPNGALLAVSDPLGKASGIFTTDSTTVEVGSGIWASWNREGDGYLFCEENGLFHHVLGSKASGMLYEDGAANIVERGSYDSTGHTVLYMVPIDDRTGVLRVVTPRGDVAGTVLAAAVNGYWQGK